MRGHSPDQSAAGNLDDEVLGILSVLALASTRIPVLGVEVRLVVLVDEIVQIPVCLKKDVAALTPVAPTGTALGAEGFSEKRDAPSTPIAGPDENFDGIDEHKKRARQTLALLKLN